MEIANIVNDERSTSQLICAFTRGEERGRYRFRGGTAPSYDHSKTFAQYHPRVEGNIRVFCRIRPPSADERAFDSSNLSIDRKVNSLGDGWKSRHWMRRNRTISRLIESSPRVVIKRKSSTRSSSRRARLDGYKVCIFTYGQTEREDVHDARWAGDARVLIPRSMEQIFSSQALLESKGMKKIHHRHAVSKDL